MVEWGMIMRTSAIDRLINEAISAGIDTVLNLGAGLDTRPYRMNLPASLRWVEVDFPSLVDLKNATLGRHRPACDVERVAIDLLDRPGRIAFFSRYAATSENILVITEGVLSYFPAHEVSSLASDMRAIASIRLWIQDFDAAGQRPLPRGWEKKLQAAPLLFKVRNWFEFFEKYGWRRSRVISNCDEAEAINRPYPLDFPFGLILRLLPKAMRRDILGLSGAALMGKTP
jgi:methyltransferase (TIGR00027 family)